MKLNDIVLITGASGFLGRSVAELLLTSEASVRTLTRSRIDIPGVTPFHYAGTDDLAQIAQAMHGASVVIHLAARVHVLRDRSLDPLADYRRVNVCGTEHLARAAANAGVRDFLMASSVKAMGNSNTRSWTEADAPHPTDPYGLTKLEAERVLTEIGAAAGMNTASLRLPLIYGPGMKANMLSLFQLVDRSLVIPAGGIRNRRSLIYARNAAHAFVNLLGRLNGAETFLVSDGEDVSTPDLVTRIGHALGRRVRIVPAPVRALRLAQKLHIRGADALADRLLGSLTVDPARLVGRLAQPLPCSLDQGLAETAAWYRSLRVQAA